MTITVIIGNSDNNLTQQEWSDFVKEVNSAIHQRFLAIHFFGYPPTIAPWQNAAWVFDASPLGDFQECLTRIRVKYRQKSMAFIAGQTEFI